MNRKRLGYLLIGTGLVAAIAIAVLVYQQVADAQRVKAALPTSQVVVATDDIAARTEVSASQVGLRAVEGDLVYAGAATKLEDVVGKFSPQPIAKGELINTRKVGPEAAKNAPSYQIEKGKEMYVMPISFGGAPFSVAQINALRPGDRVDLLYTSIEPPQGLPADQRDTNQLAYLQTRIMLQDLRIQDLGVYADDGTLLAATADPAAKNGAPTLDKANIIFVVTPEQALVLKWLRDVATYDKTTNIDMVLRSPADDEQTDANLVVNLNYMRQNYNFRAPVPAALAR